MMEAKAGKSTDEQDLPQAKSNGAGVWPAAIRGKVQA
jgi:hypothetical protein